jgi:hypothetical protein
MLKWDLSPPVVWTPPPGSPEDALGRNYLPDSSPASSGSVSAVGNPHRLLPDPPCASSSAPATISPHPVGLSSDPSSFAAYPDAAGCHPIGPSLAGLLSSSSFAPSQRAPHRVDLSPGGLPFPSCAPLPRSCSCSVGRLVEPFFFHPVVTTIRVCWSLLLLPEELPSSWPGSSAPEWALPPTSSVPPP